MSLLLLLEARATADLAVATVVRLVALCDPGIAREVTGCRRNRALAHERYLAILSEGTEPA